jgi:hypothetical protein
VKMLSVKILASKNSLNILFGQNAFGEMYQNRKNMFHRRSIRYFF